MDLHESIKSVCNCFLWPRRLPGILSPRQITMFSTSMDPRDSMEPDCACFWRHCSLPKIFGPRQITKFLTSTNTRSSSPLNRSETTAAVFETFLHFLSCFVLTYNFFNFVNCLSSHKVDNNDLRQSLNIVLLISFYIEREYYNEKLRLKDTWLAW